MRDGTAKQIASAEHRSWEKRRLEREQASGVEIAFRGRVVGCLTGPGREDIPIAPQMSSEKGMARCKATHFLVQMIGANVLQNIYPSASTWTHDTLERREMMSEDRGYVQSARGSTRTCTSTRAQGVTLTLCHKFQPQPQPQPQSRCRH